MRRLSTAGAAVRRLPRYQIVARMKRRRVRQEDVARAVGVTASFVNHVLSRRAKANETTERIWKEIERVLV